MVTPVRLPDRGKKQRRRVMSGGSSPIRVLAVDDHPLVRQGIAGLIGVQAGHDAGRGSQHWPRGDPAIPDAPSRRNPYGPPDAGDEWPRWADRHSDRVSGGQGHHADDLRGRRAHPPRPQGGCSGLPAQEHPAFGPVAHDPRRPRWQEEPVARGLLPGRRAHERRHSHPPRRSPSCGSSRPGRRTRRSRISSA